MNNQFCAFLTYFSLIMIAGKVWGKIDWNWWIVLAPMWGQIVLGGLIHLGNMTRKNRMRSDIASTLTGLQDLVKKARTKEKEAERRTVN